MNYLLCSVCDRCQHSSLFIESIYILPDPSFIADVNSKGLVLCTRHSALFIGVPKSLAEARKYNRHQLRGACKFMGCKLADTQRISTRVFGEVTDVIQSKDYETEMQDSTLSVTLQNSFFMAVTSQVLGSVGYSALHLKDFEIACDIVSHKRSIVVLLGGTSGTGKSTLSSLVASRLGISTVLSTDSIRHIMRTFIDPKTNPILFSSSYETGKHIHDLSLTAKQACLKGHAKQCGYIFDNLARLIQEFQERKESVVIEGVHLSVSVMKKLMQSFSSCVPFIVCIKDKHKHKERFAVRSKQMTLDPLVNRYIAHFTNIRAIQKSFLEKADETLIPKVDNNNLDRSLGIVHATLIRVLRRLSEGQYVYDHRRQQCSVLHEEFNIVTQNIWTTKAAQTLINERPNKGELLKRFLDVMAQDLSPAPQLTDGTDIPDIGSLISGSEQFDLTPIELPSKAQDDLSEHDANRDEDSFQADSQDSYQSDSENSIHEETAELSPDFISKPSEPRNIEGSAEASHSCMIIRKTSG
jgi:2-phosphoglycerate kinase